jgi:AAA ATPase containing von Willebrand factor type A (vWA) domain
MPKRKREDTSLPALLSKHRHLLYQALKTAKGFERQRQSKRLRDPKSTPDKKARIEKEVVVLKSLDLRQAAHAHLCHSLLRIKGIAESDKLPEEFKAGVPKPQLEEEERVLLHNVTSNLYNRKPVIQAIDRAVEEVCKAIGVPVPEKKRGKKGGKDEGEKNGAVKVEEEEKKDKKEKKDNDKKEEKDKKEKKSKDKEDKKREQEKEKRKDKYKKDNKRKDSDSDSEPDSDDEPEQPEIDESEEERAVNELDKMLGLASDESEDEGSEEDILVKGGRRRADLDPNEITTDEEDSESENLDPNEITDKSSDSEESFAGFSDAQPEGPSSESSESQSDSSSDSESSASESKSESHSDSDSSSSSSSSSSRPSKKRKHDTSKTTRLRPTDSTFLPTLMGGYISGSESEASDLDIAPRRKNRRGQRARQKIWEKKYGEQARHLQKKRAEEEAKKKGRDAGWDLRRGAVGEDGVKPWKKGIKNPLKEKEGQGEKKEEGKKEEGGKKGGFGKHQRGGDNNKKRDDTGPLHPSWEAKKKLKEKEKLTAPFQGKKITFD